jgi:hypothetical protein
MPATTQNDDVHFVGSHRCCDSSVRDLPMT